MTTHAAQPIPASPVWGEPVPRDARTAGMGGTIRRFTSLAATIALVLAVAVGGWLAMMQLQPGDTNPRLAVHQATPENAAQACEVEPLTVDETMQIVRNPYLFLAERAASASPSSIVRSPDQSGLIEAALVPDRYQYETAETMIPPKATFDDARNTVDRFLHCLPNASYGQLWAMLNPIWVQHIIVGQFPVFAAEGDVLEFVQQEIDRPVASVGNPLRPFYHSDRPFTIRANPNRDAAHVALTFSSGYSSIVAIGAQVTGANGEIVLETDSVGTPQMVRADASWQRPVFVVGKSAVTGEWYILPWLGDRLITM